MSRTCQIWFAIGASFLASAAARGDDGSVVTTVPRPPMTAYQQSYTEELPQRPTGSGPPPPSVSYGAEQLPPPPPSSSPPAGSPYVGGPPPVDQPPILGPDFDAQPRHRWLSIDEPTAWLIYPSFSQHLAGTVDVGGLFTTTATLPSAKLDFTAAPGISIRADLPRWGPVWLGYRYIASEGSGTLVGFDPFGPANLRSRLDVQVADLTWARHDFQTHGHFWDLLDQDLRINDLQGPPTWIVTWDVAARVANLYFDSHAIGPVLDRQIVNYFLGGGAKVGVTLTRLFPTLGMSAFGHVDIGAMMGGVRQQFSESLVDALGNPIAFGYSFRQQVQTVPTLAAQMGLSTFGPHRLGQWQAGYQFEQWWAIANLVGSSGDFLTHSVFVRWVRCY